MIRRRPPIEGLQLAGCPASSSGAREHGACSARRRACCFVASASRWRLSHADWSSVNVRLLGHVGGPGGAPAAGTIASPARRLPAPPGGDVAASPVQNAALKLAFLCARRLPRQERAEDRVEPPSPCATACTGWRARAARRRDRGTVGDARRPARQPARRGSRSLCAAPLRRQSPWSELLRGSPAAFGRPGLGERGPACGAEPGQPEWTPAPQRSSAERAWRKSEREAAKIAAAGASAAGRDAGEPVPSGRRERLSPPEPGEDRALRGRSKTGTWT